MAVADKPYHCPNCGAICEGDEPTCWHCDTPVARRPASAVHIGTDDSRMTSSSFSLASLLMGMTVASIALGMAVLAPCVGVPLAIVLLVAWARTAMAVQLLKRQDFAPEMSETFGLYFRAVYTTLAVVVLIVIILYASFWLAAIVAWGTSALFTKLNVNRDAEPSSVVLQASLPEWWPLHFPRFAGWFGTVKSCLRWILIIDLDDERSLLEPFRLRGVSRDSGTAL
jgi:hypothetical protein